MNVQGSLRTPPRVRVFSLASGDPTGDVLSTSRIEDAIVSVRINQAAPDGGVLTSEDQLISADASSFASQAQKAHEHRSIC